MRDIDLIVIGELIERKRMDLLAEVPAHLSVRVIGDGPLRLKLQELFSDKPNIELLGSMPNELVLDLLSRSKVMLHCSNDEGLPRVFGEALACGTPIICSEGLRCGSDFPKQCISQADSSRLTGLALDKLEDSVWLQQAQLIGKNFMRQNHSFIRMFSIFSKILKDLHPPAGAFLP